MNWLARTACLTAFALAIGCQAQTNGDDAPSADAPEPATTTQTTRPDPLKTIDDFIASANIDKSDEANA